MRIIDETYFKGNIAIPNIEKDLDSFLSSYVDRYEKEILIFLLGYNMYTDLMEAMEEATLPNKWDAILNGATFNVTINGKLINCEWIGLKNDSKISLIAYYVFFHYLRDNANQFTGLSVIKSDAENADVIDPNNKLVWAWNQARNLAGCYDHELKYATSFIYNRDENTLFSYLANNISDYQKWHYKPMLLMNTLGA